MPYNSGKNFSIDSEVDFFLTEMCIRDSRMLDMGFIHDIKKVLKLIPARRQTLFFSATMPSEIEQMADSMLTNPKKVEVDVYKRQRET